MKLKYLLLGALTSTSFISGTALPLLAQPTPDPSPRASADVSSFNPDTLVGMDKDRAIWMATAHGYRIVDNEPNQIRLAKETEHLILTIEQPAGMVRSVKVETAVKGPSPLETEVLALQTSNYSVRVFRRNEKLWMNVFNKPTGVLVLNAAPTQVADRGSETTYQSTGALKATVSVNPQSGQKYLRLNYGSTVIEEAAD